MEAQKSQNSNQIKTAIHMDTHVRKRDGRSQFLLRIYTGNRKYIYIRTGKFMERKFWVENQIRAIKGNPGASKLKGELDEMLGKCERIVNKILDKKQTITRKKIEKLLFSTKPESGYETYLDFMQECHEADIRKDIIRERSIKREKYAIRLLKEYDCVTPLEDIDDEWLEELEEWLVTTKGYSTGTRANVHNILKKHLRKGVKKKLIEFDPYLGFKFSRGTVGERNFLTLEELDHLHELFLSEFFLHEGKGKISSKARHYVLQYFLASCYTGLRWLDVTRMERSWLHGDIVRASLEKSRLQKTVSIPISQRLKEVLCDEEEELFLRKPFHLGHTNYTLLQIMEAAGIKKKITFHCSRHTFACVGLEIGIPTEVIQKMLGHSNIQTTQIYARIQDQGVKDAMKAWDTVSVKRKKKPTRLQKVS